MILATDQTIAKRGHCSQLIPSAYGIFSFSQPLQDRGKGLNDHENKLKPVNHATTNSASALQGIAAIQLGLSGRPGDTKMRCSVSSNKK